MTLMNKILHVLNFIFEGFRIEAQWRSKLVDGSMFRLFSWRHLLLYGKSSMAEGNKSLDGLELSKVCFLEYLM